MSGVRRLLLVRHGITDWNREGRFQGHLDPPLSETGQREARLIATRLAADADLRPERVVSSALARASETARIIADACGSPLATDTRLIELGQGDWEGRTHAELAVADSARYEAWRTGDHEPPGAETVEQALVRISAALGDLLDGEAAEATCLVSHGGTLRLVARLLLVLDGERSWALDVDNASLSALSRIDGGGWRVDRWNDTQHLLGRLPTHVDEAEGTPLAL